MRFEPTALAGVMRIRPTPVEDERGFFARLYCPDAFAGAGLDFTSTQINLSRNTARHTLRGLHYQDAPFAEAKLIRVTRGRLFEVVVDLRPGSPTRFRHVAFELDAIDAEAVFVPEGCAHGFLTLEADTDVLYQMGRPYVPGQARGLRWDDPALRIAWPAAPDILSDADRTWPLLDQLR
jgi:dTDP-4-dehydrorhamnose 3,5-epimerase